MTDGRWPMADGRWPMADDGYSHRRTGDVIAQRFATSVPVNGLAGTCADLTTPGPVTQRRKVDVMSDSKMTYRDLDAWKLAMTLVETTYALTKSLPDRERFNLIAQMQKSATSIPSNIAEGQGRGTVRFGLWFLRVSIGSAAELDTQVELARRLHYVTSEATRELDSQLERVRQMLYGMRREHERRLVATGATFISLFLLLGLSSVFA